MSAAAVFACGGGGGGDAESPLGTIDSAGAQPVQTTSKTAFTAQPQTVTAAEAGPSPTAPQASPPTGSDSSAATTPTATNHSALLQLLQQPLWLSRDAYDTAHTLMVPLHAAFGKGDLTLIAGFDAFFAAYSADAASLPPGRLDRLQFLYFVSRYISLSAQNRACSPALSQILGQTQALWAQIVTAPAWQWGRPNFPNLLARIDWKIATPSTAISYHRAIIDEDLYGMAIAADLVRAAPLCNQAVPVEATNLLARAGTVFRQEIAPTASGGWLLKPGVWQHHPDYAYSGHAAITDNLTPLVRPGIATDVSHSFRLPLMLLSLQCAHRNQPQQAAYYRGLTRALARQMQSAVLREPSPDFAGYRTTNFMDGSNGVYRYQYATQGSSGYGPFELSGSVNYGWWAFLGQPLANVYAHQATLQPFNDAALATYVGPNTTRVRNPAFTLPGFFQSPLQQQILRDANGVAQVRDWCKIDSQIAR